MNFFLDILKGLLIGAGAILPGISSGVLCVAFGIYEKLINCVLNFFNDIKKNTLTLFPIFLGSVLGIIMFGNILRYLFSKFYIPTCYLFIGLILGSIPIIIKQSNISKITFTHLLCMLITLSFSLYLTTLEKHLNYNYISNFSNLTLIKSGAFMSAGVVIPGISSTVILMLLGIYDVYISAIASFNIKILFFMGIGLFVGGFFFLKIIEFLFKKYKSHTYFSIIGFTLGSIFVLFPGFEFNNTYLISIFLLIFGFFISLKLER